MKIKLTWRMWVLIIAVTLSLLSVFGFSNFFQEGVLVTSVDTNSIAFEEGLKQGDIITRIDGQKISNLEDYSRILKGKFSSNESVKTIIQTKDSEIILFSNEPVEITVSEGIKVLKIINTITAMKKNANKTAIKSCL